MQKERKWTKYLKENNFESFKSKGNPQFLTEVTYDDSESYNN